MARVDHKYCADRSRLDDEPCNGTPPSHQRWVLTATRPPWPTDIAPGPAGTRRLAVWHRDLAPGDTMVVDQTGFVKQGRSFKRFGSQIIAVCTHAAHDICCGRYGARFLLAMHANGIEALACSHLGGDRFAPNVVVFPDRIVLARLDSYSPDIVADALASRTLLPGTLRGRAGEPPVASLIEEAARTHLNLWSLKDVFTCEPMTGEDDHYIARLGTTTLTLRVEAAGQRLDRFTCSATTPGHRNLWRAEVV